MRIHRILARIIELMTDLYSGTENVVGGDVSCFFPVDSGVRQGCVPAPSHFIILMY